MKARLGPWARLRRSLAWKLMPDADLKLTLPGGLQFPLTRKGDQIVFNEIVLGSLYAPFFALMPSLGSFVDLGCNCGFFTGALMMEAQRRGWNLQEGLLVDAESESVKLAREFLAINGAENFPVVQALVGMSGAEEVFTISKKSQCSGAKSSFEPRGSEVMRAQSLGALLAAQSRSSADLLKIDIEGSEKDLLENEADLVASFPYVLLEWHAPHCSGTFVRDWIAARNLRVLKVFSVLDKAENSDTWAGKVGLVLWARS